MVHMNPKKDDFNKKMLDKHLTSSGGFEVESASKEHIFAHLANHQLRQWLMWTTSLASF